MDFVSYIVFNICFNESFHAVLCQRIFFGTDHLIPGGGGVYWFPQKHYSPLPVHWKIKYFLSKEIFIH